MNAGKVLSIYFLAGTVCFANVSPSTSNFTHDGFFVGLGADYNSVNITQNSWGKGVSNIQTNTGVNNNGVAQGSGTPFRHDNNTLGPSFQAGYIKHITGITGTPNLFGVKFLYQYLDSTASDANLFIPQLGQSTSATTGLTSPLTGYVNANSVQPTSNQELALLLFAGQSFGNLSIYIGAGPSLVNIKSKNYYSVGYANVDGVTIDVTGLVSYSSPSYWAWGGTAQLGGTYFFSPCWFIDMSYTYTMTGENTSDHQQGFAHTSQIGSVTYTTSGILYTKDTLRIKNQSLMVSINKFFDA